ncbi:reducing type I polyketide synthase [Nemania diffusa]|nr:reducing type I polyketide synthase [Nemania diffusa]
MLAKGAQTASTTNGGSKRCYVQPPIAIIGMACRLPGRCSTPNEFWDFMMRGGVAANDPPKSRFNLSGHFDASAKPQTMKTPGAMFMEHVDPADFDAQFFNINQSDAIAMDPQQRNLMEVAYECLENAGIPIEKLSGRRVGCLIGASAVDYYDMDLKDVEDRTDSPTLGSSRSLMSNRISHFLNVHGPSLSVDTACSSSLTALDIACLYLGNYQADAMFVGGVNMYLSPERNEDMGNMRAAASPTGRCHVFDRSADGYVAAEAINVVFLKRLDDAVRDNDVIRAVIRGTSANSAGKTPGISMPNPEAQALAIRDAYSNAGFNEADLVDTGYLECHGTGTVAGDPIEVEGVATVFARTRPKGQPLAIGSVKGNVGHSEAASGLTSVIKTVLALENKKIPGTATFLDPNPRIDFEKANVYAFRNSISWPQDTKLRASINSFGFGGSNAHAILESPEYLLGSSWPNFKSSYVKSETIDADFFSDYNGNGIDYSPRPKLIVMSANDDVALKNSIQRLSSHLLHPGVEATLGDLAFTLSERRSHLFCRGYSIQKSPRFSPGSFTTGRLLNQSVKIGLIFTGQGAQWIRMGRGLIHTFPVARSIIETLEKVLATLKQPPKWSLASMLADETEPSRIREPQISQPIVTALQIAYLGVLSDWGIKPTAVVGHSSGEIAAAVAAGYLNAEEAIKIAYLRGQAIAEFRPISNLGMLAVGMPADAVIRYIDKTDDLVEIACLNGPRSVTLSGYADALNRLMRRVKDDGYLARMLAVDFAYHSTFMDQISERYADLLSTEIGTTGVRLGEAAMFSSLYGRRITGPIELQYWVRNLRSQVLFQDAVEIMIGRKEGVNHLIEVGPSNTLSGIIAQICDDHPELTQRPLYTSVAVRGQDTVASLYNVAGGLFLAGGPINLKRVNELDSDSLSTLIDLPNYSWNHSKKFWHESLASKDWRFRPFVKHDLLGSKIPGTSWQSPMWRNKLKLANNTWLEGHKLGNNIVFPGTGYICMAIEAIYQTATMTMWNERAPERYAYRMRDIKFLKALFLGDSDESPLISLSLIPPLGSNPSWYQFKISAEKHGTWNDHASGFIRIDTEFSIPTTPKSVLQPFKHAMSNGKWYKTMRDYGFNFGPSFQKLILMESSDSSQIGRSKVSLEPPISGYIQSPYLIHPACMDGCFQSVTATWEEDSHNADTLVPLQIDSLFVPYRSQQPQEAIATARSDYTGVGRKEVMKNYSFSCATYDPEQGDMLLDMRGIRYATLGSADISSSPHVFCQPVWNADITLLDESGFDRLAKRSAANSRTESESRALPFVHKWIDLVVHKYPQLNVIEFNLDDDDLSSLWLDEERPKSALETASSRYTLAATSAAMLIQLRDKYHSALQRDYIVLDDENLHELLDSKYELAIVKFSASGEEFLSPYLELIKSLVRKNGMMLFITPNTKPEHLSRTFSLHGLRQLLAADSMIVARKETTQEATESKRIFVVRFSNPDGPELPTNLQRSSWIFTSVIGADNVPLKSNVVVMDELNDAVMSQLDQQQWHMLQSLVQKECRILWVTSGAQMSVIDPRKALILGLFRTIRNEMPYLRLLTLDVESPSGDATDKAILTCLDLLCSMDERGCKDTEFVERGGIIYISRVVSDARANQSVEDDRHGKAPVMTPFHTTPGTIKLRTERVGNLDSLVYSEISAQPPPLPDDWVEVDVIASGVNFKDAASTIGLVPEDEYLLGGEGSGVIARIGSGVDDFHIGQRVNFLKRGSFGNRVQTSRKRVHAIPDQMTFEEAATMPVVFATSIYALIHIAQIKKGDRVLIHSATGGVGLSAIQLCRYFGAEVYATVGTEAKRSFLKSNCDIKDERIFSSRNSDFARLIMEETGGYGVDIILNSLAGDLLDESWRIIGTGGTMVEIGKKDILDRNMLSMEPFNRNASFRALDLSNEQHISDEVLGSLLKETFELFEKGHIKPITPTREFSFDQIPDALRLIRSGRHIGKLVVTRSREPNLQVPVRRAPSSVCLRSDASYLIAGGLRGLCSSIAMYLAKCGAHNLVILSRSGAGDEKSQLALSKINALGCKVTMVCGDVTNIHDVRRAFKSAKGPVDGIIQGAMILNDRPFDSMTLDEYHATLGCKVKGTLNLHEVSLQERSPPKFFTLLSSISGLYGHKAQANYAAANTFLDAFASYRVGLGLPACSISLGVVSNVGYVARHDDLMDRFDESVFYTISDKVLRESIKLSIQTQSGITTDAESTSNLITGIRVPQPSDSLLSHDARFAGLFSHDHGPNEPQADSQGLKDLDSIRAMIHAKVGARLILETTSEVLNKYMMRILRVTDPLDFARPLSAYGIDSLAAVEIRNFLKVELSVDLTTLDIMNAVSLVSISERIIEEVSRLT